MAPLNLAFDHGAPEEDFFGFRDFLHLTLREGGVDEELRFLVEVLLVFADREIGENGLQVSESIACLIRDYENRSHIVVHDRVCENLDVLLVPVEHGYFAGVVL